MEKLDIIKEVKKMLPEDYAYATITSGETILPFYDFLDNNFINFILDGAKPEVLVLYIKTKLKNLIEFNNQALIIVDNFIKNNPLYKDTIQTSPTEVISSRTYLTDFCLKNITENGINYAGRTITIEELYLKLLNNEYHEPTLEEKAELCIDMTRYIAPEILSSIVDGMDMSVNDYICNIIPAKMCSATEVLVNGEKIDIDELVTQIVDHQAKMLAEDAEKQRIAREEEYNKTGDNPGLVSEIQVKLKENNSLEITAEIPVVASSLIDEEEKKSLMSKLFEATFTEEEYFIAELNRIKTALDNTNNAHDLDSKANFYQIILGELNIEEASSHVKALITSIEELIIKKRNNIIKMNNNQEEYTDVLFSEINSMNDELNGFQTLDEYSLLYGKALERYEEVLNKGITDIQLRSAFHLLFNRINEKRLNLDATIGYQSPDVERAKVELNALISDIKQDILTIEHDSNNLGNLIGTEIRLNSNIRRAKEKVEEACNAKLFTEDDREYYMNRLKGFSIAIQSENKIGFGRR